MTIRLVPQHPAPPPRLDLLERCWTLHGPSGRPIVCGLYQTDVGLEVRVGYSDEELVRSERVLDVARGRERAEQWRQAALAKGFQP